jgi:DNA-binding NarL/FixJ family response regulator
MTTNSTKPLKILIVEDDVIDRKQLERQLLKSTLRTCEIKHTEYLENALELMETDDFDITLLDLYLPDSSGIDTVVKVSERHPYAANVVITGLDREGYNLKAMAEGAQDYLVKGKFDIHTLSESINSAIERKKAELSTIGSQTLYSVLCKSAN